MQLILNIVSMRAEIYKLLTQRLIYLRMTKILTYTLHHFHSNWVTHCLIWWKFILTLTLLPKVILKLLQLVTIKRSNICTQVRLQEMVGVIICSPRTRGLFFKINRSINRIKTIRIFNPFQWNSYPRESRLYIIFEITYEGWKHGFSVS